MIRAKYNSYFKKMDWHKAYKAATITVHIKFNIAEYGVIS